MAGYKFSMDTVAPPVEGAVKLVELTSIECNSVGVFSPNDIIQIERRKFFFPIILSFSLLHSYLST